ncbi:carbohydrate ABC transporter permease [Parablautia intestinalis]|uniref:Carbohydrate ABC transporter permease n=1 Tax=Parablautia intestinalis TaxID=2320100 RepID=A0A3A9AJT6_9FIRM|nr:carbohydrate ABC transporter permease [Parablautia intestinalis]RKI91304.1 carbohydrate ABC transporter permease [Parablautia intestinalis]
MKRKKKSVLMDLIMLPLCAIVAYPFIYVLMGAFKSRGEFAVNPYGWPQSATIQNFLKAFEGVSFIRILWNNIFITALSVLAVTIISAMAAYAVVYNNCKVNRGIRIYLLLGFFIPFQATLLPLYQLYSSMGLMDKLYGIILLHAGSISLPFFMFYGSIQGLPREYAEAAWMDGCSVPGTFFRIIFPLTRPVMITQVIFTFFATWNDYLAPSLFLTSRDKGVLILEVTRSVSRNSVDWGRSFAVVTITLILPFIFFLAAQKYLISGMAAGGVKG